MDEFQKSDKIRWEAEKDRIVMNFIHGDIEAMRRSVCPYCGGHIFYSVSKVPGGRKKGRLACGMRIGCDGPGFEWAEMLDGYCPEWAENIKDWEAFSEDLYT